MSGIQMPRGSRWLTQAKFDAPKHDVRQIDRPDLFDKLDTFLDRRLGLVMAPPGFGKSSLLSQWRDRQVATGVRVGWLSLDEADAEPLQFVSYLILALSEGGLDLGSLVPLARQGLPDGALPPTLSGVLEAIAREPAEVILILDDYHRISSPAVDSAIGSILGAAPENFTLVVSSRTRPRLDLARLVASGMASEIDADLLRISREDVLKVLDYPIDRESADLLYAKTEGWPVALQLAKFLLLKGKDALGDLERFTGDSGHIASYLTNQVLSSVTQEQRLFLLETSVLERFNAELADAVTGRSDGRDMLDGLQHLNALLIPLGQHQSWFRYHHLFAEYLKDQLHREPEIETRRLHLAASSWFEDAGDLTEAVRHAREASDFHRCATLVQLAGGWELILLKGIGYLRNLLRNIPEDKMIAFPRMQVAQAYLHLKDGRVSEARTLFETVRHVQADLRADAALARDLVNVGALLDGYEDQRCPAKFDRLNAAAAQQPQSDPMTIGILACEQTLAALALGRLSEAEKHAQEAMRAMRRAKTVLGLTYSLHHAGLTALYQGHFRVAEAHFGAAYRMAIENYASDPGLRARSNLLVALLRHWRGELGDEHRAAFYADVAQLEMFDGSFELYANGLEVECAQPDATASGVARARRIASERGLDRLELLADAQALRHGAGRADHALAAQLQLALPDGVWRQQPVLWRPFVESRLALARYFLDRNRAAAIRSLDDAVECCRVTGAVVYLIDVLVARSIVNDRSGNRTDALSDLIQALSLAAPEMIAQPFVRSREALPLLRAVVKASSSEYVDVVTSDFAKKLLGRYSAQVAPLSTSEAAGQLSARENEVLEELTNGRSNKEIARALGMTENTVKSHLKRIFVKLDIGSRAQAIALLRSRETPDHSVGATSSQAPAVC